MRCAPPATIPTISIRPRSRRSRSSTRSVASRARALAEAAAITSTDEVLDVGCGIGGPARFLATKFGCKVTGIDLTPEFIDVARDLNARVGLGDTIDLRVADALDLPFPDASFDVVWTQHVSMNIADKPGLYAELGRVLRPGGRLAFFDVVAGR